jgi:endonuclease/exonuclease/phosphatase (EEP) superfamily protein YafD
VRRWIGRIAGAMCVLMAVFTGLALIENDEWWIRIFDFPRLQIAVVLAIALLVSVLTKSSARGWLVVLPLSLSALAWQVWMILPYTPVWQVQMLAAKSCKSESRVRFLMANVLQENRNARALLRLVDETDPDIILLTEVDEWWVEEMQTVFETHPNAVLEPLSNTYGIALYSQLPLADSEVRYILEDDIPSILTKVRLADGQAFSLWAVHPTPPRPGDDTDERDAELLLVAKEVAAQEAPAIVAGDLNDVAWSSTTTLFQEISGTLDPRIGRGLYATFNADWPLMKWPLDHLFATEQWTLGEFRRLADIGSDHFPILVELCHQPQAAIVQEPEKPETGDRDEAEEHIEEGRDAAAE